VSERVELPTTGERAEVCEVAILAGDRDPDQPGVGECRRHAPPPKVSYETDEDVRSAVIWPDTEGDDWCGEWKERADTPPRCLHYWHTHDRRCLLAEGHEGKHVFAVPESEIVLPGWTQHPPTPEG
jgi:hypothetical protein